MWRSSAKHRSVSLLTRSSPPQRGLHRFVDSVGAAVGEFGSLDVAPQAFDRVQFGGVGGEAFHAQPAYGTRR